LVRQTQIPALAEAIKDMARNAHQRMDLFQKAPVALDRVTYIDRVLDMRFCLLPYAPTQGPVSFETPIGPIVGPEAVFTPILQLLAAGPTNGLELARLPIFVDDVGGLLQSLQLLMMQRIAHPVLTQLQSSASQRVLSKWLAHNCTLNYIAACATATHAGVG
jgi:hypothetical protein